MPREFKPSLADHMKEFVTATEATPDPHAGAGQDMNRVFELFEPRGVRRERAYQQAMGTYMPEPPRAAVQKSPSTKKASDLSRISDEKLSQLSDLVAAEEAKRDEAAFYEFVPEEYPELDDEVEETSYEEEDDSSAEWLR